MARDPQRGLPGGAERAELKPLALALAAALAAGDAAGESVRDQAFRATLDEDWALAARLWARVDGPRAQDYLLQARTELQFQKARPLLGQARAAREREDWAAADASYLKAQAASPRNKEAHDGRARVAPYLEAHRRLAALNLPDGLYDKVGRARAREWLAFLKERKLEDRKITAARAETAATLQLAESPVSVTLTSDGRSRVEIYGIGEIGPLERQVLRLRPGDYIVVASRPGYRDARAALRVRPGESPVLDIRCAEKIR